MSMENINDRLVIDYASVCDDIENILGGIDSLHNNKLFAAALGADSSQKVRDNRARVKKRLYDAFNVVVVGDFKRGKSTLINAIIGSDVVPAAVTPETVTINRVSFSETPKVEAVLKNGKRATLSHNELKREAIEKLAERLPADIDYVDIRANVEILKDITIVDTPGLGDLMGAFDEKTVNYLVNADALIYLISVKSPLSLTERTFLSATVMPQGFTRVLIVVNMADTLETPENVNKIAEFTKERALEISPDINVYTLSALDELCRKKCVTRPEPDLSPLLEAGFLEFENALNNDIILQKDIIKSNRAIALTRILLDDIANRIKLVQMSLKADIKKLISSEEEFKNENSALMKTIDKQNSELAADIDDMRRETKNWMMEFMSRLKDEINAAKTTAEVGDLERYFQFFMSDTIKNAVMTCIERHQKDISDRVLEITKKMSTDIAESAFGSLDARIAENIADISWTDFDTAIFWGDFVLSGVKNLDVIKLGPIILIGQIIAGCLRQSKISKKQDDYLNPILQGFDSVTSDILKNTDAAYEKLKLTAIDKVRETFQSQIKTSIDAINQAKKITEDESVKSDEVAEYLNSVLTELEKHRDVLKKYN